MCKILLELFYSCLKCDMKAFNIEDKYNIVVKEHMLKITPVP